MIEDLQRKLNERADAKRQTFQKTQEQLILQGFNALSVNPYTNLKDILALSSTPDSINLYYFVELAKKLGEQQLTADYRRRETEEFLKSVEEAHEQLKELQEQVNNLTH